MRRAFVKHIGWVCMVGEVSLRLGWDLAGSVGEGLNNGWDTDITMFSFPVGYCRGSPVSHADGPDFSGKWPLLHQDMKACAQSHERVLGCSLCQRTCPLCLETFSRLDTYHLWWPKNVDTVILLFTKMYSPRQMGVCLLDLIFYFQFYVS